MRNPSFGGRFHAPVQHGPLPILDLDLMHTASVPIGTYTRATGGYTFTSGGVLAANTANQPRPDYDPATLVKRGWLMEGSRTNLLTYSEQFDNAAWSKTNVTCSAGSVTAPDGTATADAVVLSSGSNQHYIAQSIAYTSGTTYTLSAFVKDVDAGFVQLTFGSGAFSTNPYCNFDLDNGVAGTPSNCTAGISSCGNGWYRCWIIAACTTTASANAVLAPVASLGVTKLPTWSSDGSSVYLWGAQLEAATFPSSYIPTTTTSASRSADLWTISNAQFLAATGQNIPQEGTVFVEFAFAGGDSTLLSGNRAALALDDGTSNERHLVYNNTGAVGGLTTDGGATIAAPLVAGTVAVGTVVKTAYRFAATAGCQFAKDGVLATGVAPATMPTTTAIAIGGSSTGGVPLYGWVRRVIVYPFAMTDAQLQTLTVV